MTPSSFGGDNLEAVLLGALPPLHRKIRRLAVERLIARIAAFEGTGARIRPAALAAALRDALRGVRLEVSELDARIERFTRAWQDAVDDGARRQVLMLHLEETVADRRERWRDVRALRRWLGFDALRERLERQRLRLLVEEETALHALRGAVDAADEEARAQIASDAEATGALLLARSLNGDRLQNQVAALQALAALLRVASGALATDPEASAKLSTLADQPAMSPWLQAAALEALLCADAPSGLVLLRRRLVHPERPARDFLFRRLALELAARHLTPSGSGSLLSLLEDAARSDPSEYVRMGVCELVVNIPGRSPLLKRLAGLAADGAESSPRVRASAVLAAAKVFEDALSGAGEALALLAEVLERDADPLVLRLACDLVTRLCLRLDERAFPQERKQLSSALDALVARAVLPGVVLESAAVARQALSRASDPARRAWTDYLRSMIAGLRVGERARIPLEPPPAGLPALPDDDAWLGAILADLSQDDQGIYARRKGKTLIAWRGDRFAIRAWRVLHEMARPAPNKRQGFRHTLGRVLQGDLRAHPGHLDEITATLVPGERVHVAAAGGWGRHLPTVDDLLHLPLGSGDPIRVFSSHGVTTVTPPASLSRRIANRLRLTRQYEQFSGLRLESLRGAEPRERRRFVEEVDRQLGVRIDFTPWDGDAPPSRVGSLFDRNAGPPRHQVPFFEGGFIAALTDLLIERNEYFFGTSGNGVVALALFAAAVFSFFLVDAYRKRSEVRGARARLPLCIGGWGTRGKSGTERLKAALFGGLGFDVFAKTTGSEAMFVHSTPTGTPEEFFIFRPYDKATIWEQRDMANLASRLGVEVFLWECMALQPGFVDLLQNDWMHDDYATLTNAYPDHEDVQGPAGMDVAEVIARFMPEGNTVVTTEDHFLPLFRESARQKATTLVHSPWWEAELIPEELLALFPYREHPRNMALVATLGEQLGVPRPLALGLMAEYVRPEIGVLKVFPRVRVRGRVLRFINGHSANERTGFLNNWRRTGLDQVDSETSADAAVVTVLNNRWDRVARSEVFARIIVEDAPADRHVLIGTNLEGLQKYIRDALDEYLARVEIVAAEDLAGGSDAQRRCEERLARQMAHLKIPRPSAATFLDRLERYASGAGLAVDSQAIGAAIDDALAAPSEDLHVSRVRERLAVELGAEIEAALRGSDASEDPETPEVLQPATSEEVRAHALYLLARMVVHGRLQRLIPGAGAESAQRVAYHRRFAAAFRELFLEQIVPIPDANASGDQIIDRCARAVAPGLEVSLIGAQNIKGTGLDWVYRWLAVDRVQGALTSIATGTAEERRRAIEALDSFEDNGFVDAGLASASLPRLAQDAPTTEESERLRQLAARFEATREQRVAALTPSIGGTFRERLLKQVESFFDYLDSVRRRRVADRLVADLVAGRISHARAAVETRKLYERQKGGWLVDALRPAAPARATPKPVAVETIPPREEFEKALTVPRDVAIKVPEERPGVARRSSTNEADASRVPPADERDPT